MSSLVVGMVWLGCLAPYLASKRQTLWRYKPPKVLAWLVFILMLGLSIFVSKTHYGFAAASLIVLAMVMCMWILLVLSASYLNGRLWLLSTVMVTVFSLISFTGNSFAE